MKKLVPMMLLLLVSSCGKSDGESEAQVVNSIEEEENIKRQGNKNKVTLSGDVLNDYAKTEQTMNKNAGFI